MEKILEFLKEKAITIVVFVVIFIFLAILIGIESALGLISIGLLYLFFNLAKEFNGVYEERKDKTENDDEIDSEVFPDDSKINK